MKTRFGPGRPTAAQDSAQEMAAPSSHSQLWGKFAGKESWGLKLIEFCIEFLMPVVSAERYLAYSAPMRVAPANAADCLVSDPRSATPTIMRRTIGATTANSAATLPRQPAERTAQSHEYCVVALPHLMTTSFDKGGSTDGWPAAEACAGATRSPEASYSSSHDL